MVGTIERHGNGPLWLRRAAEQHETAHRNAPKDANSSHAVTCVHVGVLDSFETKVSLLPLPSQHGGDVWQTSVRVRVTIIR